VSKDFSQAKISASIHPSHYSKTMKDHVHRGPSIRCEGEYFRLDLTNLAQRRALEGQSRPREALERDGGRHVPNLRQIAVDACRHLDWVVIGAE